MSTIPYLRSVWWSQNVEVDPIFAASPASGITPTDITNWDTAYGWGDHSGLYIPVGEKGAVNGVATLDGGGKVPQLQLPAIAITDTFVVGSQAAMLALVAETGDVAVRTDTNETYILMGTDPTVLGDWQLLNPVLPAESDPVFVASPAGGIIAGDITNWDNAFGWGDHALAGYLTSYTETDPVYSGDPASGIAALDITNWDTAYGWGDHSLAGYLTALPAHDLDAHSDVTITASGKGDILVYDSNLSQYVDLAPGTDTHVLTADSSLDVGVKWAAAAGGGSSITVQDEGSTLTTAVTLFNFVGNAVAATEPVADQITVTVTALTALSDDLNPTLAASLSLGGFCIEADDQATGAGDNVCLIGGDSLDSSGPGGGIIVQSGIGNGSLPSLTAAPAGAVPGGFVLADLQAPGYGYMGFAAPADVSAGLTGDGISTILTLPEGDGATGQVMVTDGGGTLSWATPVAAESDPVFTASPAGGISALDITNWDSWLTSPANGITNGDITNWDNAHSWGDHSLVGYLTSVPAGYVRTPMIEDLDVATWDIRGSDTIAAATDAGDLLVRGGDANGTGSDGGDAVFQGGEASDGFGGAAIFQGGYGDCTGFGHGLAWVRGTPEISTVITCVAGEALVSGGDNTGQGYGADATFRGGHSTVNRPGARAVIEGGSSLDCSDHAGGVWIYDGQGDGTLPAIPTPTGTVAPMRVLFVDGQATPGYVGLQAPADVSNGATGDGLNTIWVLPEGDGTGGQALVTDGAGNLSWASAAVGSAALHTLTAALGANTLDNADWLQRWNWQFNANGEHGLFLGETADSTNGIGNQDLLHIETNSESSTADPIGVYQGSNMVLKVFGLTGTTRINAGDVAGNPGDLEFNTLTASDGASAGGDWNVLLGSGDGQGDGGDGVLVAGSAVAIDVDAAAAGAGGDWDFATGAGGDNASDVDGTPGAGGDFVIDLGNGGSLTHASNAGDGEDAGVLVVELGVGGVVAGAGSAGEDSYVDLIPQVGSTYGARVEFRDSTGAGGMSIKAPDTVNTPGGRFELAPVVIGPLPTGVHPVAPVMDVLVVDATGGPVTLLLHPAADERFRYLVIKRIDASAFTVTITPTGTDAIDLAGLGVPLVIPGGAPAVVTLVNNRAIDWWVI